MDDVEFQQRAMPLLAEFARKYADIHGECTISYWKGRKFLWISPINTLSSQKDRDFKAKALGIGDHDRQILDEGRVVIRKIKPNFLKVRHIPGKSRSRVICYSDAKSI